MYRIIKSLGEKLLKGNISFYQYEGLVFLIKYQEDNIQFVAKSSDGFNFQLTKPQKSLLQYCETKENENHTEQKKYRRILSSYTETGRLSNLFIQAVIPIRKGKLVIYHFRTETGRARVSALLLSKQAPHRILWQAEKPVWQTPKKWTKHDIVFLDLLPINKKLIAYWRVKNIGVFAVSYPQHKLGKKILIKHRLSLKKPKQNPIISPDQDNSWEAFTTFNPAAIYENKKVHIFYRAQGYDYYSSIGYAKSSDGIHIEKRYNKPVFQATQKFEKNKTGTLNKKFVSGGGHGGCEDPRITKIDGQLYMTYVAFDGYNPPRIALTSITLEDFLSEKWLWTKPVLISPPGVVDKSCCILPEKINGKYVIFHRIFPDILIDFVDTLEFDGTWFLQDQYKIPPRSRQWWDSRKIGAGAPPLKTKDGWLLIYQAVDDKDTSQYKIGAMLLDLNNPTKVLHRSSEPILKPDQSYEHHGFKAGVVYPCGAVIIKDTLFVYYGAADSYVSVATAKLDQFLHVLKSSGSSKIYPTIIEDMP